MEEEAKAIKDHVGNYFIEELEFGKNLKITCEKFTHNNNSIYLTQSGIGSINAAINLSLLLDHIDGVEGVILLGVGGALTTDLEIGDLVISESIIQHDYLFYMDFGKYCITPGEYAFDPEGLNVLRPAIKADLKLAKLLKDNLKDIKTYEGIIASGSEFAGTSDRKKIIHSETNALLVEMEAAAVSQVCKRAKMPFVVAKTVSDRLNADGGIETDFQKFLEAASITAAKLAKTLLT